jgi:hypothetical protein
MKPEGHRGIVRGSEVHFPNKDAPFTDGTEVLVTPTVTSLGTAAALLAAIAAAPQVPSEWVDELEQLIRAGERPPNSMSPF